MPSLYAEGWRQGSLVEAELGATSIDVVAGEFIVVNSRSGLWVVTSQDCDLDSASTVDDDAKVELRPVREESTSVGWGIRSHALRLDADLRVEADDPRLLITPRALTALLPARRPAVEDGRARALKTWLGRRYDRPAVPEHLVPLARAIAGAVRAARTKELADNTHDVLFAVRDGRPPTYELVAVVSESADVRATELWLANAAMTVDAGLGVLDGAPVVTTRAGLTLDYVENSYSADLSDVTWGKPAPRGEE